MILYFSSTGNSKHIAERLGESLKEKIISIEDCLKNNIYSFDLEEGEKFGVVSPVYFFGLPTIVSKYIDSLEIPNSNYYYACLTYGSNVGSAGKQIENVFQSKGTKLNGLFGIKMVDTYSPIFNLNNNIKNKNILYQADKKLDKIIFKIKIKSYGKFGLKQLPSFITKSFYRKYAKTPNTHKFEVLNYCIGCSKCAENCPNQAIELQDGKPVWIKDKCTLCLRCLHHCPKFAIQYGKKTLKHGQYDYNNYQKNKNL